MEFAVKKIKFIFENALKLPQGVKTKE